jgi:Icc-related predicted phosphoesterase
VTSDNGALRIAAIGDLHVGNLADGSYSALLAGIAREADVLLLAGDLTETGTPEQTTSLVRELQACSIRKIAVLGNHDHDSGQAAIVSSMLRDADVTVLDGDACAVDGVGFAGVKGFAGGFGNRMLSAFGEEAIKEFVSEAEAEAKKLEHALSQLHSMARRVVLLHYAPVRDTVVGENEELFPFLGSSRLEHVIDDFEATLVIHGHAHHGSHEGRTARGVPVYNVAAPLMRQIWPERPYRIFELERTRLPV